MGRFQVALYQHIESVSHPVAWHFWIICPGKVAETVDADMPLAQGQVTAADDAFSWNDEVEDGSPPFIKAYTVDHSLSHFVQ